MNISWEAVSQTGPTAAHHTGAIISQNFYIHGGIVKTGSTDPSNQFYKFDLETKSWTNLSSESSPSLSHHASVVADDRYLILIGGWNGKARCSDIHIYDTEENTWRKANAQGFPQGAGLSSHTAIALINDEILIIGREGSLRTQRRSGNSFLLKGNPRKGNFIYSSYPISVASRSGHTTNGTDSKIITIGGRDDKIIEQYSGFKSLDICCDLVTKIVENSSNVSSKFPSRKNHVSVVGKGGILIHGGETFDGRNRHPVGEMFLVLLKPHLSYRTLGVSDVCRAGHVTCVSADRLLIHGGFDERHRAQNGVYSLQLG